MPARPLGRSTRGCDNGRWLPGEPAFAQLLNRLNAIGYNNACAKQRKLVHNPSALHISVSRSARAASNSSSGSPDARPETPTYKFAVSDGSDLSRAK